MKPEELADRLCQIATGIENSDNPSQDLVVKSLKQVLAAIKPSKEVKPFTMAERIAARYLNQK